MQATVVASPDYLAEHPAPRTPDDLSSHNCVQYRLAQDGEIWRWRFERNGTRKPVSVRGRITVNDTETAIRAAVDGLGIVYTLDALVERFLRNGQLRRVLANWTPSIEGAYLYYQGRRQPPAALRAFIDMVRAPKGTSSQRSLKNPF
jgi:DNA-binding transcriptional LysR family regulator